MFLQDPPFPLPALTSLPFNIVLNNGLSSRLVKPIWGTERKQGGREVFLFLLALNKMVFERMEYHSHFNKTPVHYIISLGSLQGEEVIKNRDNSRRLHL